MGLLSWLAGGASGSAQDRMQAGAFLESLKNGAKVLLVDVRQPEELTSALGKLPGVKNIPLPDLGRRSGEIPKDQPVILICRSGQRSRQAVDFLKAKGYTQVKDVAGGMMAIRSLGA